MAKLPKYTLSFNNSKEKWDLKNDKSNKVVKTFNTKEEATTRGTLKKVLGEDGGSVKIQKKDSKKFQEERTYPKSEDPTTSEG